MKYLTLTDIIEQSQKKNLLSDYQEGISIYGHPTGSFTGELWGAKLFNRDPLQMLPMHFQRETVQSDGSTKVTRGLIGDSINLANIVLEEPDEKTLRRLMRPFEREEDTIPYLMCKLSKGTISISAPRVGFNTNDEDIHLFEMQDVAAAIHKLRMLLLGDLYQITYIKDSGEIRRIKTTLNQDFLKKYYASTPQSEDEESENEVDLEDADFKTLRKIAKACLRLPDLELPSEGTVFRVVHMATIISIDKISVEAIDQKLKQFSPRVFLSYMESRFSNKHAFEVISDEAAEKYDFKFGSADFFTDVLKKKIEFGSTEGLHQVLNFVHEDIPDFDLNSCRADRMVLVRKVSAKDTDPWVLVPESSLV